MGAKARILIVDDDPKFRKSLTDILGAKGYAPIATATGTAALEMVEEEVAAVALIDLKLEDMSGLELIKELKECSPGTECILITGYASKGSAIEAVNLGAYGYVRKPYDMEQLLVTIRRATEKREAAEALKKSEERYRDLYEKAPNAYFSINAFDGSILRCNSAALQLLGYDRETIMKMKAFDLYADTTNGLSKTKEVYKSFKAGESIRDVELQMKHKDGHPMWISLSVEPLRDRAGNIIESRSMVIDISERKRAEDVLRESEEKYRTLFTEAPDMIHIVDENGRIIDANWEELETMGYTREEYFGKRIHEVIHPDYRSITKTTFESVLKGERINAYETAFLTKHGDKIDVEVNAVPQFAGERIVAVRAIIRDIRERKRTDEILKASLKEKEVLLREIHHRVKNNMQVTSSLLKLQSAHVKDKKALEILKEGQNRIKAMALVHSQLYQSEDLANIQIKGYVNDLIESQFQSYGVEKSKVSLKLEIEDVLFEVDFATPFGLVINELVSNSLKYAFPQGRKREIRISFRSIDGDEFELIVSDDGIGMPEDLDFENTESFGLYMVRMIVEAQLNGEIELDRTNGTTFTIKFKRPAASS